MKIIQVDHLLPLTGTGERIYFCNNSLLHYENDLFLMTFRRIEFHIPNPSFLHLIHPWKIWDNGFKFLHPDPDRPDKTKNYGKAKYRTGLSADQFVSFVSDDSHLEPGYKEFDSTGIVILRHCPANVAAPFSVLHFIDNLFGSDMNQDCRISRDRKGELWLTYNGYMAPNLCKMIRRKIVLNMEKRFLYLFEEEEIIPHSIQRPVEKNCIMDGNKVYYSFNKGVFHVIRDGVLHQCPVPFLQGIVENYENRFVISLGTPPLEVWPGRHVAIGHIKIEFRSRLCLQGMSFFHDSLQEFIDGIDWTKIYLHGKYLYFMFFFEFNEHDNIMRISDCFLPTDSQSSHLPYLLTFPMGFTANPDRYNFWLSYGEGDVRCKILTFSRDDLDNLLIYPQTRQNINFRLLNVEEWNARPKIYHVGYFFEKNCGDDMFRVMFQTLRDRYYSNHLLFFRNQYKKFPDYDPEKDKIIFGGGDIVNRYFLNDLFQTDGLVKDAVSIGIPFINADPLLTHFRRICLRSRTDIERLGGDQIVYFPDLGFLMPRMTSLPKPVKRERPRLGICLARTFFKKGNEQEYVAFIFDLVQTITGLLPSMDVYLIPFCTRRNKRYEDDGVINSHVMEFFRDDPRVVDTTHWIIEGDPVFHTYHVMSTMDFMFCSRFHSHVFSIALEIPFISFSRNRKVLNLMKECNLDDIIYVYEELEGLPIRLDSSELINFVLQHFHQRALLQDRLSNIMKTLSQDMDRFLSMWQHYIETGEMLSPPREDLTLSAPYIAS